ncbi:MAG: hypothetical protein NW201_07855 [Gemmatimonadales bacterium]|nr:hypothetical protein [Gemmatimonadales bacterium]
MLARGLCRSALPLLAALSAACLPSPGPDEAEVAALKAATLPAQYREWWEKTEQCSGLTGRFERIEWTFVEGRDFACSAGRCVGRWTAPARVEIAEAWRHSEMVVRHEMLHVLLNRRGHPDPPFARGCGLTWESWRGDLPPGITTGLHVDDEPDPAHD